jgi:hypothetical protein
VDAWRERMLANKNIIPTNIGLDGTIGGATGGKWYGGVYGWAFSVKVPQSGQIAHRNLHAKGFVGFMNAYMLTGDDRYLEPWRKQIEAVNTQKKVIDGKEMYPTMYGDKGWYAHAPAKYSHNAREIWYLSMKPDDCSHLANDPWLAYLDGKNPHYPEKVLRRGLESVRQRVAAMRRDTTTPDTRLADDPLPYNPASVVSLIELMLGGIYPGHNASILHCRLRYFDPFKRRAGIPEDTAALVEEMSADRVVVSLVNVNQLETRTVVIQTGGYGEHEFTSALVGGHEIPAKGKHITVRLRPGAGARLVLHMRRYVNPPTLAFPWDQGERR